MASLLRRLVIIFFLLCYPNLVWVLVLVDRLLYFSHAETQRGRGAEIKKLRGSAALREIGMIHTNARKRLPTLYPEEPL